MAALLLTFFSCTKTRTFYHEGVSKELARYRSRHIYDVSYHLDFTIPQSVEDPVTGVVKVHFKPLKARHGVILDFQPGQENIHRLFVNGVESGFRYMNGHIYIDANGLVPRQNNVVEIQFTSSDQSLNRSDDYMYTLLVPDRASTIFPCFDQPDIKAIFSLNLNIPETWTALSNGPMINQLVYENKQILSFEADKPISTYLFAFTAGKFDVLSHSREGRTIHIFHRETDKDKILRNAEVIFNQHFDALSWLEEYTGIDYPYSKLDMAILPGFQYSGMEHPGAIWYRDSRLLLDKNPSLTRQISQASLIAHETAHMWFGNLVTMKWFDDVWLKEVFAGFMADKIIAKQFPDVNHQLQFVLSHNPKAYAIDRSNGTHPIKQNLANLKYAGTLYGPVIYNKAPVVFQQLEQIMGEENFRKAVREYLNRFAHANADWKQLADIFDSHSSHNISAWSNAWVFGEGMPEIQYRIVKNNGYELEIETADAKMKEFPSQLLGAAIIYEDTIVYKDIWLDKTFVKVSLTREAHPSLVLLNGKGLGYGFFRLHPSDIQFVLENLDVLTDETFRASVYINLYENFLNETVDAITYFDIIVQRVKMENDQQMANYLLSCLHNLCINFLDYENDTSFSSVVETLLWERLNETSPASKEIYFQNWIRLARSSQSLKKMADLYNAQVLIDGFILSEQNRTDLACEIYIRKEDDQLLEFEKTHILNTDRLRRFEFIIPSLSHHKQIRDDFFQSLMIAENRNPEPWVIDALYYLHHPVKQNQSIHYISSALHMLEEIQITGDIFFPQNWIQANLQHYKSAEVAGMVNDYLNDNPRLPENLRLKVLQSADILFRTTSREQ
jgi:aminopeptidase N